MRKFILLTLFFCASKHILAQQPVLRDLSCSANSASSTNYACSVTVAPTGYISGTAYKFKADLANTGAATINFNSLGAIPIKKVTGGVATALASGDIQVGQWVYLTYDGTNMQMASQLGNGGGGGGGVSSITFNSPLTGGTITSSGSAGCQAASASQAGCLSSTDWSTFNNKQASGSYITSITGDGTASGPAAAAFTLASVNSNVGTFGSSVNCITVTVNGKGLITAISQTSCAGGGSGTATAIVSGTVSSLPATCTTGDIYFTTDQPASQQLYLCSATNTWTQFLNLGGSGALTITGGSLDINPSVLGTLGAANSWTGINSFTSGLRAFAAYGVGSAPSIAVTGSGCAATIASGSTNFAGAINVSPSGAGSACTVTFTWSGSFAFTHYGNVTVTDVTTPTNKILQTSGATTTTTPVLGVLSNSDVLTYTVIGW